MTSNNITTAVSLNEIAPEVIYNIFSFLSYPEVYRIRCVCRKFQVMGEYHIYQQIKTLGQKLTIKLDGTKKTNMMELEAAHYDVKNRVIEFKPVNNSEISLGKTSSQQWSSVYYRLLNIHFSGWFSNNNSIQIPSSFGTLSPQDQAMFLYHYQYNASIEKTYELPSWHDSSNNAVDRFLGDKGLILNLSYNQTKLAKDIDYTSNHHMTSLPTSYYSYRSIASSTPMSMAPVMEIKWVRVTLDWILLGMIKSNIQQRQIYEETFGTLNRLLAKEGCFKYNPLSEPILNYIVNQQEQAKQQLPESLIKYVHSHTHECHTRLSRLQHMLEGAGVDAQVIWKYTFAKSFVVGNGSLLGEEDVVRRIQDSEEEWRQKKLSLTRRLFINNYTRNNVTT